MYLGRIIEQGTARAVTENPQHPYTQALISALPEPDPDLTRNKQRLQLRSENIPNLAHLPSGCPFHPRCPAQFYVQGVCDKHRPELARTAEPETLAACHVTAETEHHAEALAAAPVQT
jgi:oligopeptide/dipeptide ABC transporter ATP-binding protein